MIGSIQIVRWKADDHTVLRVADVKTPWGTALVVMHDASIVEWWFSTFELTVGAFPMRERGVKPTICEAD